jgi:hypothetical protein
MQAVSTEYRYDHALPMLAQAYGESATPIGPQAGSDQHMPARICMLFEADDSNSAHTTIWLYCRGSQASGTRETVLRRLHQWNKSTVEVLSSDPKHSSQSSVGRV